jgi:adenylate cyclase
MVRRLRLGSGLVLLVFVLTHFLNHALGLVSLEALDAGRTVFLAVWRSLPATLLFYAALLAHLVLSLWAIFLRRRLAMPTWEAVQLVLGLAIPPLILLHILGTRFAHEVLEVQDSYIYMLLVFNGDPSAYAKQIVAGLIIWTHGCVGVHFWLRLKPAYRRLVPYAYAAALLLPVVALLGVQTAEREVVRLAADPAWMAAAQAQINFADAQGVAQIKSLEAWILSAMGGLLVLTLAARGVRAWWARRQGIVELTYPDGRRVTVAAGTTILDASRGAGIPHASVCGGRGRCSTCRVRVGEGLQALTPPSEAELKVLARVGAAPNVRLACQTSPNVNLEVTPLLPPAASSRDARARPVYLQGQEREIAILFADLRGFTALSEDKLPYDVVFVLNRYFAAMGLAVEESGGRVDKFIGDGVMALFGIENGGKAGCSDALSAARRMAERLMEINAALKHDLDQPLRIGIGIHTGPVIVGEMGYGRATSITAIGDAVNTASRLEALTKEFQAQLVLSDSVAQRAGVDLGAFPQEEIEVRGRQGRLAVRVVRSALALPVTADREVAKT